MRMRVCAMQTEVPVLVVCREPLTDRGLVPIVSLGHTTVRGYVAPPDEDESHDLAWVLGAQEALGDLVYVELPETGSVVAAGDSVGVIESVWFESVEFLKVRESEVTIDLVFVDDALRKRFLRHLSLVYLLLHRSLQPQNIQQ